jgi:hypothetical protein
LDTELRSSGVLLRWWVGDPRAASACWGDLLQEFGYEVTDSTLHQAKYFGVPSGVF